MSDVVRAKDQALALAMTVSPNGAVQQRFVELLQDMQRQYETQERQLEVLVLAIATGLKYGNWPGDTVIVTDITQDLDRPDRFSTDENP